MTPEQEANTAVVLDLTEKLCTVLVGQTPQLALAALMGTTLASLCLVSDEEQADWIADFRRAARDVLSHP